MIRHEVVYAPEALHDLTAPYDWIADAASPDVALAYVTRTRIFDRDGRSLGRIENFMVDKRRGHVEHAVLSFGGVVGMGDRCYPLPWNQLEYDERLGRYCIEMTERDLERAPSHRAGTTPSYDKGYSADIWS